MPTYDVIFTTTASYVVTVEADSVAEAEDLAFDEADFPYFPGGMDGDISGEWEIIDVEEVD